MAEEIKSQETVETETAETKSQETKEVETNNTENKKENYNALKRELSKEYGINLFDVEGIKEFKEFQESQKTEMQKLQEQLDEYNTERSNWESQKSEYEAKLASFKLGIHEDSLSDAVTLAKNYMSDDTTLESALEKVLEKYPSFKSKNSDKSIKVGTQVKNDSNDKPRNIDEIEKYLLENYKNSRYYTPKK
jgi:hypothetical protein